MCLFPVTAYYSAELNPTGKRSLIFRKDKSHSGIPVQVPCQKCINCRLERARTWAVRCIHEKSSHSVSTFITITYDPEHLPAGSTLVRKDPQLFLKRLRKARDVPFKFFGCGEYGERTARPHYHIILFGTDFADKRPYKTSGSGEQLYRSAELSRLWDYGDNTVGSVTFASAAYVAGYCTKKITGKPAEAHYGGRLPEFGMYSKGIGRAWFDKHHTEYYRHDAVIMNGKEMQPPRYYDKLYAEIDQSVINPARLVDTRRLKLLSRERRAKAMLNPEDNTTARRKTRERFAELKALRFKREFD